MTNIYQCDEMVQIKYNWIAKCYFCLALSFLPIENKTHDHIFPFDWRLNGITQSVSTFDMKWNILFYCKKIYKFKIFGWLRCVESIGNLSLNWHCLVFSYQWSLHKQAYFCHAMPYMLNNGEISLGFCVL